MTYKPKIRKAGLYYLAGPYTHKNPAVVVHRRLDHLAAEKWLMDEGIDVIAPINSSGALEQVWDLPIEYKFWQKRDRKSIKYSDGVIVIALAGWEKSVGVTDEMNYAKQLDKPIHFLQPVFDKDSGYIVNFEWVDSN